MNAMRFSAGLICVCAAGAASAAAPTSLKVTVGGLAPDGALPVSAAY
jgi:hypothetical protein